MAIRSNFLPWSTTSIAYSGNIVSSGKLDNQGNSNFRKQYDQAVAELCQSQHSLSLDKLQLRINWHEGRGQWTRSKIRLALVGYLLAGG